MDNSHFVVSYLKFAVLNIFVNITVFYISINQVRDINMIGLLVIAVFFVYFSALYAQSYTDLSLLLPYR